MLTSTASQTATTATGTTAATQKSRTDLGQKDIFLKLLVAQMKYQDPQKPQDPTQMASQLAQFNMVEQQTSTNDLLTQLLAKGGAGSSSGAPDATASWLGHTVTVKQDKVHFSGTPQSIGIDLPSAASTGFMTIADGSGTPVRTVQLGAMSAGTTPFTWNGLMDNGATAPVGDYTVQVSANDVQGQPITPTISRSGIVDAVRFTATGNELMVGGIAATTADITEIRP